VLTDAARFVKPGASRLNARLGDGYNPRRLRAVAFPIVLVVIAWPIELRAQATQPAVPVNQPAARIAAVRARQMVAGTKAQRDAQRQNVMNTPDGGTFKLDDLVRITLAQGRLKTQWVADASLPNRQPRRIKIEGSNASWLVNHFISGPNSIDTLTRFDFDAPDDDFWMIQLSFQQALGVVTIYAQGGDTSEVMRLYFQQQSSGVVINLSGIENGRFRQVLTANAPDLFRLRDEHPLEVTRHLAPILRKLTGRSLLRPGAGDVYRVFSDIPADPAVTARIVALLPALMSDNPDQRDAATLALHATGPAGALAALRLDRDSLFPEQQNRMSTFVSLQSRMTLEDPAQAAIDPLFLIDCFEDDDLAVRQAAKSALEKVIGRPVDYDPAAPPERRASLADALRAKLYQSELNRRAFDW
jgi:hypothetical protein